MKRIALYARVSTEKQEPETQLMPLRSYAARLGGEVEEFVDCGESGAKTSRPEWNRLFAAVKQGRFDTVIVARFDRLSRSLRHLLDVLEEFRVRGVRVVSLSESFDTDTPMGRAMIAMVGAMAEFERDILSERVKAGMARAKAQGKVIGKQRKPLDLARVRAMRVDGQSYRAIARELGCSVAHVYDALKQGPREYRAVYDVKYLTGKEGQEPKRSKEKGA